MISRLLVALFLCICVISGAHAQSALPSGYLMVSGNQIQGGTGTDVRMACVNADNSLPTDVGAMQAAGFNCVRYSWWDARLSSSVSTPGSLLAMDAMVSAAAAANMRMIFVHRGNEGSSADGCLRQQKNGLWYDLNGSSPYDQTNNTNGCGTAGTITYAQFRTNWINVATRYAGNTTVIGFDLHQEPLVPAASWSANNICANCGTDVSGMCSDVGTAIHSVNTGALIICEGPLNNSTKYLNGATLNAVAGTGFTVSDLSMAASSPVTGFPTNKLVYSAHDYPCNVGASCPSSGQANITAKNTAWGYLVIANTAPVFIGEVGCSCDGTNGNLNDDNNWATAFTQYANGQTQTLGSPSGFSSGFNSGFGNQTSGSFNSGFSSGFPVPQSGGSGGGVVGPTFPAPKQGLSTAWWDWGSQSTSNPNGILLAGGAINASQKTFWFTLLYNSGSGACGGFSGGFSTGFSGPGGCATTGTIWNPTDKSATITLSNSNLTAANSSGTAAVRGTTSKTTGKWCWEVAATSISGNWDVGIANATYLLSNPDGLGADANGIGFDPNFNLGGNQALGVFYLSLLSSAADSTGDSNGAAVTMCADFGTHLYWVTSPRMRALGNAWNNSASANPATEAGGLSISGLTCPCFITWQEGEAASATINAVGPFAVSTPAGFSPWDGAPALPGHFLLINLGANDNDPFANDNVQDKQLAFIPLQKVAGK